MEGLRLGLALGLGLREDFVLRRFRHQPIVPREKFSGPAGQFRLGRGGGRGQIRGGYHCLHGFALVSLYTPPIKLYPGQRSISNKNLKFASLKWKRHLSA